MKPEGEIESYMVNQSEKKGILCYKFVSPGHRGVPDRILIGNGQTVFVELKAPGETPRELQEYVMKQMRKAGADVEVADTKEDVDRILNRILEKKKS